MKLPKPYYELLRHHFKTDPGATHMCTEGFLTGTPSESETSAVRLSEALVLALGLVSDRASIIENSSADSVANQKTQRTTLLARYGYRTDLCPHGLARSAPDLAYFLEDQWGRPAVFPQPGSAPDELQHLTGVIAFVGLDGELAPGHIDLWDRASCVGTAYWDARKAMFWKLVS